jgi:hypothetical protein
MCDMLGDISDGKEGLHFAWLSPLGPKGNTRCDSCTSEVTRWMPLPKTTFKIKESKIDHV